ncbi:PRC-barrel domain-containing protein [Bacillus massilinigeriensis]|uniref:PRC-barrel domain-containing protein n=1 Tax=Bacillus massilionigeriensis TaxID=1805475 RepID=UPI00096B48CF|nr:PRC-barrel domain-containing protein [Bacillus massilionigeriensis]
MRTFSLLKGLPVYALSSGARIGQICDISISSNGTVKGLIIKKGAFLKRSYLIDILNISSFGWDGIMVEDEKVLEPLGNPELTFDSRQRLNGKMLMSAEGERLGILEDVYFQEELGTIVGYECSDGFFSDITEGKRVIKTDKPPAIGKDAIIVNVKE